MTEERANRRALKRSRKHGAGRADEAKSTCKLPGGHSVRTFRLAVLDVRPQTPVELEQYIRTVLGFQIPSNEASHGHTAPLEYLCHSYFEDRMPRDCIVWANRGGGKTQLAAIATLLDLIFKPGIQIRILGGSFDQSSRMHGYLRTMLERAELRHLIKGRLTGRRVELINGARVEVLSQSERAIRGQRVHKLRCDELELFDRHIWEAAQLVTRSGRCGDIMVRGCVEAFSTMHRPHGLVQSVVEQSRPGTRKVFKWNLLDTLEQCPPMRQCSSCVLWDDCGGIAKQPLVKGFLRVEDAIQQKQRVGEESWAAEMMCRQPRKSEMVFPEFDEAVHVASAKVQRSKGSTSKGSAPGLGPSDSLDVAIVCGIDFGYRAPTVLLWAMHDQAEDVLHVIDELIVKQHTTAQIIAMAEQRTNALGEEFKCERPQWVGADPAGHARSEHTGQSTIGLWNRAGWQVRTRAMTIDSGVQAVRARLKRADGSIGLRIEPRCRQLIKAMSCYHYPNDEPESLTPVKDGHDHACDALRYLVVNLDRGATWRGRGY
jgi:hypothetical protein